MIRDLLNKIPGGKYLRHLKSLSYRWLVAKIDHHLEKEDEKTYAARIDINMKTSFTDYLFQRLPPSDIATHLFEVSELFPKDQINQLFRRETEKLLQDADNQEQTSDLLSFRSMDHVAYIDRAVRNAGVRDPDIDPLVQDLLVKLLMGSLFTKYVGQPMVPRFKVAVTNSIRTMATKRNRIKKRFQPLEDDVPQQQHYQPDEPNELLARFRSHLRNSVGHAGVMVLDQRLDGGDTKELIGKQGLETSYRVKQVVAQVKDALKTFSKDQPEFRNMVQRALEDEANTLERRFGNRRRSGVQA